SAFQELATDLIGLKLDVIVTHGTPGTTALQRLTKTLPIVMATSGDAVLTGLVRSFAHPSGNTTGLSYFSPELADKRLELIKEIMPSLVKVAFLTNPGNPIVGPNFLAMESAAKSLKLTLQKFEVRSPQEFESVFADIKKNGAA